MPASSGRLALAWRSPVARVAATRQDGPDRGSRGAAVTCVFAQEPRLWQTRPTAGFGAGRRSQEGPLRCDA